MTSSAATQAHPAAAAGVTVPTGATAAAVVTVATAPVQGTAAAPARADRTSAESSPSCTPAQRVTRSLLGYGIIAGPLYVIVGLTQTVTRAGFDPSRHAWSQFANGGAGWVHITNLIVTGLMTIAFAVGLRRALTGGPGARWAPRLIAVYGSSMVAAGTFRADPANGFPVGTPDGPGPVSWHGLAHLGAGAVGFTCLTVATFVVARRFAVERRRGWAIASRVIGIVFMISFAAMAAGGGAPAALLAFTVAVVGVSAWITALAVNRYRAV